MRGNQSIEDRAAGLQPLQSADLVEPHQPAVLDDVGRKDRGEFSFDYLGFSHRYSLRAPMSPRVGLTWPI
jgi:hypothetical protein